MLGLLSIVLLALGLSAGTAQAAKATLSWEYSGTTHTGAIVLRTVGSGQPTEVAACRVAKDKTSCVDADVPENQPLVYELYAINIGSDGKEQRSAQPVVFRGTAAPPVTIPIPENAKSLTVHFEYK